MEIKKWKNYSLKQRMYSLTQHAERHASQPTSPLQIWQISHGMVTMEYKSSFQFSYYKLFWKYEMYFHLEIKTSVFFEIRISLSSKFGFNRVLLVCFSLISAIMWRVRKKTNRKFGVIYPSPTDYYPIVPKAAVRVASGHTLLVPKITSTVLVLCTLHSLLSDSLF